MKTSKCTLSNKTKLIYVTGKRTTKCKLQARVPTEQVQSKIFIVQ